MHFYAWKKGLKTGMYYLRSKAAASAIQFTVDKTTAKLPEKETANLDDQKRADMVCSLDNPDECEACGS
jgi:ribonucleoside-diphosphate reductase alpha chain